jgi:predicted ferric reductase
MLEGFKAHYQAASPHPCYPLHIPRCLLVSSNHFSLPQSKRSCLYRLIGITYKTWRTPIKDSNLFNTRSGIGGFADRIGAFAFALTPLTIALCARDSVLSILTSIPYQSFNFLHRWTGRIILVQSFVHCIIWTIVEGYLYQPQPKVYVTWIKQEYMIWGIVAQSFIFFLFVFSLRPVIRWTGYEFFRKSHFVVAILYIGGKYCAACPHCLPLS